MIRLEIRFVFLYNIRKYGNSAQKGGFCQPKIRSGTVLCPVIFSSAHLRDNQINHC